MEQVSSRGHHSGVARAVEAHRQQVEDRQFRKSGNRGLSQFGVSEPSTQYVVANQVQQQGQAAADAQPVEEEQQEEKYNQVMIEPATSASKLATVWSFQNSEPGRPSSGDPIPKGSFLDLKA